MSFLSDTLQQSIKAIQIDSAYGPTIRIDDPFHPSPGPSIFSKIKPKITIEFDSSVSPPLVLAPYGDPGPSKWPTYVRWAEIGAVAIGGLAIVGLLSLAIHKRKRLSA